MDSLLRKRLVVVTGKGGVGKSSVAAALALWAAEQGLRVLLCEVGSQPRLGALLDLEAAEEGAPRVPREAAHGLFVLHVTAHDALREYALEKLRFEAVYRAVFENRVARAFLRMIPSLSETVVLGKVCHEERVLDDGHPRWDLVILDAPASGHAFSLLRLPRTLLETVAPGPMRYDAQRMQTALSDPERAEVLVVALPEEMPVDEAVDLVDRVRSELELPLRRVVLNGYVYPRLNDDDVRALEEVVAACADGDPLSPAEAAAQAGLLHARRAARSEHYGALLRQRLPDLERPVLPRLATAVWGRRQIERLATALAATGEQP